MGTVVLTETCTYNNKYGRFPHDDIVGQPWGSKMLSDSKRGFVVLLAFTPELWTNVLNHRTQILYHADISLISMYLGLRPGVVMVEAGNF